MSTVFGRRRAIVAILAAGGLAAVSGATAAHASFGESYYYPISSVFTSDGTAAIHHQGAADLHPQVCEPTCRPAVVTDLQWSPDGTRAVFLNQFNQIQTYGEVSGDWLGPVPAAGTQRRSPTFDSSGRYLIWSERSGPAATWHLQIAQASKAFLDGGRQWSPDDGFHYTSPDATFDGKVVFQRNADDGGQLAGVPEVWQGDLTTGVMKRLLTDASQPTAWGTSLAYVHSDGAHQQIYRAEGSSAPVQLTTGAADHTNPVWSTDAGYVTYNVNGNQVGRVAEGGSGETTIAGLTGTPTYQWRTVGSSWRIGGGTAFETATRVSQSYWGAGKAESVVIARSDGFADALGGSALAAAKHGPLLLTETASLNALTAAEITRILPKTGRVYLLGGTSAISDDVAATIRALGYNNITRLSGADRYETSVAIANEITTSPEMILAATGENFPDALTAGAAAGAYDTKGYRAVVLLTKDATLPAPSKSYLDLHNTAQLFPIGGQAVAATAGRSNVTTAISGADRYETAARVADVFFPGTYYAGVATGENWPDALAGGALLGTFGAPLFLTKGSQTTLQGATAAELTERSAAIQTALVFGNSTTVPDAQALQVKAIVAGTRDVDANPTNLQLPPAPGVLTLTPAGTTAKKSPATLRFGTLD